MTGDKTFDTLVVTSPQNPLDQISSHSANQSNLHPPARVTVKHLLLFHPFKCFAGVPAKFGFENSHISYISSVSFRRESLNPLQPLPSLSTPVTSTEKPILARVIFTGGFTLGESPMPKGKGYFQPVKGLFFREMMNSQDSPPPPYTDFV